MAALQRLAPGFEGTIGDDTPLAENGLCLDSIALTDLIAELEQSLSVTIAAEAVCDENFGTVGRLLAFLRACPRRR